MKLLTQGVSEQGDHDMALFNRMLTIPHKILSHHDVSGLAPIVLHELGHIQPIGLDKAGYLVDNPDFNCLKGVAGYCSDECKHHQLDMWQHPEAFVQDMESADFHKHVATYIDQSLVHRKANGDVDDDSIHSLGTMLGMKNPSFITWKMRHGNNGILIFEGNEQSLARYQDFLRNFVALLSLC